MGLGPGADTDGVQGKRREGKIEGLLALCPSLLMASRILQHHALMYPCRFCDSEVTPSISDTRIPHCRTQLHTEAAAQCIPALSSSILSPSSGDARLGPSSHIHQGSTQHRSQHLNVKLELR